VLVIGLMSQAYPIIEKFNNVEGAQVRARELLIEGFVVLQATQGDDWVGYSAFRKVGDKEEESYLLEFETPNPEGDPQSIYKAEMVGLGVINPRGVAPS
jgi:hypothetical protein